MFEYYCEQIAAAIIGTLVLAAPIFVALCLAKLVGVI